MKDTYFRKGFGLKAEVKPVIDTEYHSALLERIRSRAYTDQFGDITVRLAKDFGFCYGVDRAVDYAYQTRHKFPDKRVFLVGEIIHNPHVNHRLQEKGIEFLYPSAEGRFDFSEVTPDDVVIIPAFGVTIHDMKVLQEKGCVLVDTTCGSVLLVWKRVDSYARDGFTAVIHGKYQHEESRATASQALRHEGGKFIVVRNMAEAEVVGDYMTGRPGRLDRDDFVARFRKRSSDGFDPDRDLRKVGVANQTTMLATESLAIGARLREMMVESMGEEHAAEHFRSFGTICSATQERQDAVLEMMQEPPDIMLVVGGYNSSNTNHLAHLCREYTTTFHVKDAECIDADSGAINHKPELDPHAPEVMDWNWLPPGPLQLGITAGASTPNNEIGKAVARILAIRGIEVDD
ncbi:MAG: 4-hydroxy-3-methylbut-2-enyl diphosphate reductase [Gemmatimonadetes bacterium]|nr:4-hydroxy-3-methylbut-2-enyl diphosphate reductase [Gemmatimonadota bacterium]MYI06533.1 4-hydroxy-3-methylbut-2-enyl diphosphate reductase [Gemmatimonadota bacterium]